MERVFVILFVMLSVIALPAIPGATERVTLVGKVNDNFQIVAGNETYEVKNNAA